MRCRPTRWVTFASVGALFTTCLTVRLRFGLSATYNNVIAIECLMDDIALEIAVPPLEFRLQSHRRPSLRGTSSKELMPKHERCVRLHCRRVQDGDLVLHVTRTPGATVPSWCALRWMEKCA